MHNITRVTTSSTRRLHSFSYDLVGICTVHYAFARTSTWQCMVCIHGSLRYVKYAYRIAGKAVRATIAKSANISL